ncbi:sentrin-specific protease 2 isoform X2 [Brienomyrus brachyistius]|uniref:sentrin-specific protease 2 isoform X2 n=1 Tax=Brienomyrus brachyistius TaxID=42636 RepID=UPI0020B2EE99|nr:sentrin-specific protease 2 isoform X2 [Brienomyrus brachyistius]
MYEWIVDGISSLFVPRTGQKSAGWPRNGSSQLSAADTPDSRRPGKHIRPAKRNYQSVHLADSRTEYGEIKRARRDVVVSIVKKTISGVAGLLRLQNPFMIPRENTTAYAGDQDPPDEPLGVDEIQSHSLGTWISYMEIDMEKPSEVGYSSLPPPSVRKHNGTGVLSERIKDCQRSLQLLPPRLVHSSMKSSNLNVPATVPQSRNHRPCLAVEEALKESDKEHYRRLVQIVSEIYPPNKPLPFARMKPPVKPFLKETHKPAVFSKTGDTILSQPGPVRVNTNVSVWRGARSTGPNNAKENGITEPQPMKEMSKGSHIPVRVQAEDTILRQREKPFGVPSVFTTAEKQEAKPVDVDLSDEVATRLNIVESVFPSCSTIKAVQPAHDSCFGQEEFPRLTKEMQQDVSWALEQRDPNLVLSSAFKLRITQRDLATLQEGSWLNDEIINFYMNLLMCRSEQENGRKVYAFSTFFFQKLHEGGHAAVRRWTKAVDLFQYEVIIVPLHLGVHWSLAVMDLKAKSVKCYDSMGQRHDDICKLLLLYLKEEYKTRKNKDLDVSKWVVASLKAKEIPQQNNGSDCGVFACKYADYISQGRPLTFTQSHMPYFRRKMIWEILNKRLL